MNVRAFIAAKRTGEAHTGHDVRRLVRDYTEGAVPEYQMAAWLMAVCFKGLDAEETFALTDAISQSGHRLDFSGIARVVADKHSTGGVGDKVTVVLAPLVVACGLPFVKMSGRGLGHTGGTIDKLESVPGFETGLSVDELKRQVSEVGLAVSSQTADLAPADRLLYALRDATATVDEESLIASSIMGKKLAGGADVIVLDVKVGRGAFISDLPAARRAGRLMEEMGEKAGRSVRTVVSAMDDPLGRAVGNLLEIREALAVLEGGGPDDVRTLSVRLAAHLLVMAGHEADLETAAVRAEARLDSGAALETCRRWFRAQGAIRFPESTEDGPHAPIVRPVPTPRAGWIAAIDAGAVGRVVHGLGGGRTGKDTEIDPLVGVVLAARTGDHVEEGETLAYVHAADERHGQEACSRTAAAFLLADTASERTPLVLEESPL